MTTALVLAALVWAWSLIAVIRFKAVDRLLASLLFAFATAMLIHIIRLAQ